MISSSHEQIDRRSLAFANLVADKLEARPELLDMAISNLDRWIQANLGSSSMAYLEWRNILKHKTLPEILELLRSDSEEARRLRQSNPFAGLLTPQERWLILKEYDAQSA